MSSRTDEGNPQRRIVSIVTDFGLKDPYVGVMKGVILGINPLAEVVDITHDVAPQAVVEGAFVLRASWSYFPPGSVHLAVVDPGVGTERAPIAVAAGGHFFVGPDNGLFTPVLEAHPDAEVRRLSSSAYRLSRVSATFHGRDVFAPAAAWLSRGVPISRFGPKLSSPVRLPFSVPSPVPGGIAGQVVYVDRFGNLVTNIDAESVPREGTRVRIAGQVVQVCHTYGDVPRGQALALVGSFGFLEVSVNGGSASEVFNVGRGTPVVLEAGGPVETVVGRGVEER